MAGIFQFIFTLIQSGGLGTLPCHSTVQVPAYPFDSCTCLQPPYQKACARALPSFTHHMWHTDLINCSVDLPQIPHSHLQIGLGMPKSNTCGVGPSSCLSPDNLGISRFITHFVPEPSTHGVGLSVSATSVDLTLLCSVPPRSLYD